MTTAKRAQGRPRAFDEDDALDAALELFWRIGYRSTTTRALEEHLGLTQSSIYNTFGSKRELFERALDRYEARTTAALIAPLERATGGLASVARFFDALAEWVTDDGRRGCLIINLMAEDGGEDVAATARTRAYRRRVRNALRGALARAERRGEVAANWAEVRAELLFGEVMGLNIIARGGNEAEVRALVDGVRHLLDTWALAEAMPPAVGADGPDDGE